MHRVTADFFNYDASGSLVSRKVPVVVGDPGETYVLIETAVVRALHAGFNSVTTTTTTTASAGNTCKLTFFHDSQCFGFGKLHSISINIRTITNDVPWFKESSSCPRLLIPQNMPRQTDSDTSPAILFLTGKMHEITLDGTPDGIHERNILVNCSNLLLAQFAKDASAVYRRLGPILEQLKDM